MTTVTNAIGRDEYNELMSGDLIEVIEMHSHGRFCEVTAVGVSNCDLRDGDDFQGFVVAIGLIGDEMMTPNVTYIDAVEFDEGATKYYAFTHDQPNDTDETVRDRAIDFAFSEFKKFDLPTRP